MECSQPKEKASLDSWALHKRVECCRVCWANTPVPAGGYSLAQLSFEPYSKTKMTLAGVRLLLIVDLSSQHDEDGK